MLVHSRHTQWSITMSTFKVSTKQDKGAQSQFTALTIDWTGCDAETIKAMATQALVVKLQGTWRRNGIPAKFTCIAAQHAPGTRHATVGMSEDDVRNMMKVWTAKQREAYIGGMSVSEVMAMEQELESETE